MFWALTNIMEHAPIVENGSSLFTVDVIKDQIMIKKSQDLASEWLRQLYIIIQSWHWLKVLFVKIYYNDNGWRLSDDNAWIL